MGRFLSTVIAVAVLLGLGALAVLALPTGSAPMAVVTASSAAQTEAGDTSIAAPAAWSGPRYNHIALPLNPGAAITPFNAQGLLNYIGPSARQVANLAADTQALDFWDGTFGLVNGIPIFDPADYPLQVGHPYLVLINSSHPANTPFSIVGNVPNVGDIHFTLVGKTPCNYNEIMVPLDQYSQNITNAGELASAIGNVNIVAALYPTDQNLDFWDVSGFGLVNGVPIFTAADFPIKLGYPYFVCVNAAGNNDVWP